MTTDMPSWRAPKLEGEAFEEAFPFYVLMDRQQRVLAAGRAIARALPALVPGVSLASVLVAARPRSLASTLDWHVHDKSLLVLRTLGEHQVMFRGAIQADGDDQVLLLLSPVLTDPADLRQLGLSLGDLALHDPTGDMLMLQQAATTSLEDARQLTNRLRQRSQQLQAIMELAGHGVAYFSLDGDMLQSNLVLRDLMAWPIQGPGHLTLAEVEAQIQQLLVDGDARRLKLADLLAPDGLSSKQRSITVETRAGTYLRINYRATVEGAHVLYVRDVTMETQVDRMKSEFLTIAAHELRTPLASIFGFSEILANRPLNPERTKDVATRIYKQAKWMVGMLNELLDLARIEARKDLDMVMSATPLSELIRHAIETYCDSSDLSRVQVDDAMPELTLQVDVYKARQALGHVVSNAVKYSPGGETVHVRAWPEARQGKEGVWIEVTDQGIGMSPAQVARVFERFYRADPSCNIPGSGLGMSLANKIVGLHGGAIEVQSQLGQGTQVLVWLPLALVQQQDVASVHALHAQ